MTSDLLGWLGFVAAGAIAYLWGYYVGRSKALHEQLLATRALLAVVRPEALILLSETEKTTTGDGPRPPFRSDPESEALRHGHPTRSVRQPEPRGAPAPDPAALPSPDTPEETTD